MNNDNKAPARINFFRGRDSKLICDFPPPYYANWLLDNTVPVLFTMLCAPHEAFLDFDRLKVLLIDDLFQLRN